MPDFLLAARASIARLRELSIASAQYLAARSVCGTARRIARAVGRGFIELFENGLFQHLIDTRRRLQDDSSFAV